MSEFAEISSRGLYCEFNTAEDEFGYLQDLAEQQNAGILCASLVRKAQKYYRPGTLCEYC